MYERRYWDPNRARRERRGDAAILAGTVAAAAASYAMDKAKDKAVDYAVGKVKSIVGRYKTYSSSGKKLRGNSSKNKILRTNTMPYKKSFLRRTVSKKTGAVSYRRPTTKSKRPYKKRSSYRRKPPLTRQVREIKKALNADQARFVFKSVSKDVVTSSAFAVEHEAHNMTGVSEIEGMITQLRYYDPSNPGTLVTANANTGTYSRKIHFKNIHAKLDIKNSYQIPCRIKVYIVTPKSDTNLTPLSYYTAGITDQVITGGDETTPLLYLTDINNFNSQWKAKLVKDVELMAGKSCTATWNSGSFDYDPSVFDAHTVEYQTKFKSAVWVIRIESPPCHDATTAGQVDYNACSVDVLTYIKAEVLYDAGCNLDDIYISNNLSGAFTSGNGVTGAPLSDNYKREVA